MNKKAATYIVKLKMLKKIILLILFSAFVQLAYCQTIYFCTRVSKAGIPADPSDYWSMVEGGGILTIVFKQDAPIYDSLYIRITKIRNTGNDENTIVLQQAMPFVRGRRFQVASFDFQYVGKYVTEIFTMRKVLANRIVTIGLIGEENIPASTYRNAHMAFCTKIKDSIPVDTGTSYGFRGVKGVLKGYITNDKPLLSSKIYVQVLRKSGDDFLAVDYFDFPNDVTSKKAFFDIPLTDGGTYEIVVRNEENALISARPVKVFMTEQVKEKKE